MAVKGRLLAAVIPAYAAAGTIESVIVQMPDFVDWIIVVDDGSTDGLAGVIESVDDPRIRLLRHDINRGVGAAMITGFREALDLGAHLIAKIDADGQMDPVHLKSFAMAALHHHCDYVKANRFGHLEDLQQMPRLRLTGSLALTFFTKFASGYWNVFDPQNGYVMITRTALKRLNLNRLDSGYFFENSMLIHLNIIKARIGEIYIPARYGDETSSMRVGRIAASFPFKLTAGFLYRIYQKYVFRSLSPYMILVLFGLLAMGWGVIWGALSWYRSMATGIPATTGTVVLALLPLLLGWSALLQALVLDVQDAGPCLLFDYDDETLQDSGENGS